MTVAGSAITRRLVARWRRPSGLEALLIAVGALIAGLVFVTLVRLALWSWGEYGLGIPQFYWTRVITNDSVRSVLLNTAIVVSVSSVLAVLIGAVLAWLNERTDASFGTIGRILPLVPFLMPAISLPLGWTFLAAPRAGMLNVITRAALARVGVVFDRGPLDLFGWPGMIFLYTVFLCGFAYLVIGASMRNLNSGLEEAAKLAGAGPLRIQLEIVFPALRTALASAFFMCVIIGLVMYSVPVTIGGSANIQILSVLLINLITTQSPPAYGAAFLIGLLLLIPILLIWWLQRRTAQGGRNAVIGGRAAFTSTLRLGARNRLIGRAVFVGYATIAVLLPIAGLAYVGGLQLWSGVWPESWDLFSNVRTTLTNATTQPAILWSAWLGVSTGIALVLLSHLVSYGNRMFRRLGPIVDALAKSPAVVAQILIAIALLVTLGGPPFNLLGTAWILFLGYLVLFMPFASVLTTGALQEVGSDVIEAATLAGASEARTFRSIVTPLARSGLVASFLLMYVLVSGETNASQILASTQRPVVGYEMVTLYNYGSFPQVASFALVVTIVNLACVGLFVRVFGGSLRK